MSSIIYNTLPEKNTTFFDFTPSPPPQTYIDVDKISIPVGKITTIYGEKGSGSSYYCHYLTNRLDNSLYINTGLDYRGSKLIEGELYYINSYLKNIILAIRASIISGIKYIIIDRVNYIVDEEEIKDDFFSLSNIHPSRIVGLLLKELKFLCLRYNITFILVASTTAIKNKTDSLLQNCSAKSIYIKKNKNLYAYGDPIGFKTNVNDLSYKVLERDFKLY